MPDGSVDPARPARAIAASLGINLAGVLPLFLTGGLAVQIGRSLDFGPTGVGVLAACYALSTMVGSAPLGGRVGRFGIQRSLRLAGGISALALTAASVAPTSAFLGLALVVGGLANALGQPSANATLAQHVPPQRFGLAFAIKQSGIPIATLLAGLAVPSVALTVGWRWAFALAAILAAAASLLPPPDRPAELRRTEGKVPRSRSVPLWVLASGLAFAVIAASSIGAFGASGGVAIGMQEGTAGLLVAAGGLAGLAIRLGAGVWADRTSVDALVSVAVLLTAGAVGWGLMAVAFASAEPGFYVLGLLIANAFGWGWPGLLHLSVARLFPSATAAASGVTQTGVSAGLLVGPLLLGLVIGSAGWQWAWTAVAASGLVSVAVTLGIRGRLAVA